MKTKDWLDVTLALNTHLPAWPGDPAPTINQTRTGSVTSSRINASLHWGTHLDAPFHLNPGGWALDQIPTELLLGPVQVVEIGGVREIGASELEQTGAGRRERLLVRTGNSAYWGEQPPVFHPEFASFTPDAAEYLLQHGVRLLGLDYFSIDLYEAEDLPVHRMLYSENVVGLENLDLRNIAPGDYQMICLPLKVAGGDGAPARVLLRCLSD